METGLIDAGTKLTDGFGRRTEDYRVPSYPYTTLPDPAELPFATQPATFNSRQPNSWTRSNEAALGGSYLFHGGYAFASTTVRVPSGASSGTLTSYRRASSAQATFSLSRS